MARKILIMFAIIIAAFPFLGFSETTDTTVSTILSLLIAITLLFSRRPKMVPNNLKEELLNNMPSPFVPKMQDIPVNHPEKNLNHSIPTNISNINPVVIKHVEPEVPSSIPSPLPIMPKRRIPLTKFNAINVEDNIEKEIESTGVIENIPHIRKPRKNSPRVLLAYEEQVHPADVPTQTHRETNV